MFLGSGPGEGEVLFTKSEHKTEEVADPRQELMLNLMQDSNENIAPMIEIIRNVVEKQGKEDIFFSRDDTFRSDYRRLMQQFEENGRFDDFYSFTEKILPKFWDKVRGAGTVEFPDALFEKLHTLS